MQQHRSGAPVRRAHIELDGLRGGRGFQSNPALLCSEVARQWHLRRIVGHLADRVADDQLALDQRHPAGAGHHRVGGIEHFGQPGPRPVAQRRQRGGGTRRCDEVVGRGRHAAVTQQPRRADEPPADPGLARMLEHVRVPARAAHARAVTGGRGEAAMGPRHPTHADLHPCQAAQRVCIGARRWQRLGQRRHVPGAADDGDALVPFGDRLAQHLSHVGLALRLAERGRIAAAAHGRHRHRHRLERRCTVAAVLDHVVPPTLRIGIAGRLGQGRERITDCHRIVWFGQGEFCFCVAGPGQGLLHRQVHRPHHDVVLMGPGEGLPLRAELGERQERGSLRMIDHVPEQGNRRHEMFVAHPGQRCLAIGGQLDQHRRRVECIEGADHRPSRPRPVVADPQQLHPRSHGPLPLPITARGTLRRSRSSRPGRGPRLRGTRATQPCRAPGPSRPRRRSRRQRRRRSTDRRRSGPPAPAHW